MVNNLFVFVFVLPVLRFTPSDYHFGIFKLLDNASNTGLSNVIMYFSSKCVIPICVFFCNIYARRLA